MRAKAWKALAQRGRPPRDGTLGWLAALLCLVLALAQPRWGRLRSDPLPPGHDVVLLFDVSRSMAATDAVPDRIGVAREAARSLISSLAGAAGNRAGVVAFAGRGVFRCPLTENLGAVLDVIDRLRAGGVRPGGTDLGAGLDAALDAFDAQEHAEGRTIVVFTDGEDHEGAWESPGRFRTVAQGGCARSRRRDRRSRLRPSVAGDDHRARSSSTGRIGSDGTVLLPRPDRPLAPRRCSTRIDHPQLWRNGDPAGFGVGRSRHALSDSHRSGRSPNPCLDVHPRGRGSVPPLPAGRARVQPCCRVAGPTASPGAGRPAPTPEAPMAREANARSKSTPRQGPSPQSGHQSDHDRPGHCDGWWR